MKKLSIFIFSLFLLSSCEEVKNVIGKLSESDNVNGLKEALTVGAGNAANILGKEDGYLLDKTVRILLPEEAQTALNAIKSVQEIKSTISTISAIPGLSGLSELTAAIPDFSSDFDNVLFTAINRAAESAAPQSVGIFIDAITSMSIQDATGILFSDNKQAATNYLGEKTYTSLQSAFSPVINESLDSVKIGNSASGSSAFKTNNAVNVELTVLDAWTWLSEQNNNLADKIENVSWIIDLIPSSYGNVKNTLQSIKPIDTDLGAYVTGKALDGLFIKVGDEETKIRTDVNARTSELLQKVFGQLDK